MLEVLVSRLVAPYVGLTLETYTASIGVALGAIAAGAALGGRLADAVDPRRWLGPVLALGGALLLLARPTVFGLGPVLGAGAAATVLLVAAAVGPSVLVLSSVAPGVVKLRLRTLAETGATVGRLSALGTVGALAGTFLTGYVLLSALPVSRVLLAVGLLLWPAGSRWRSCCRAVAGAGRRARRAGGARARRAAGRRGARRRAGAVRAGDPVLLRERRRRPGPPERPHPRARRAAALVRRPRRPRPPGVRLHPAVRRRRRDAAARPARRAAPRARRRHLPAAPGRGPARVAQHRAGGRPRGAPDRPRAARPGDRARPAGASSATRGPSIAAQPTAAFDVVVGDAFGSLAVPWHLTTTELVAEVRRVLRPGGAYLLNVIDNPPLRVRPGRGGDAARGVRPRGAGRPAAAGGRRVGGNLVLVGRRHAAAARRGGAARRGAGEHGRVPDGATFAGGAQVLTDDDAPVDQLLTPYPSA